LHFCFRDPQLNKKAAVAAAIASIILLVLSMGRRNSAAEALSDGTDTYYQSMHIS
jgi:hypothetical protein